jgi:ABC-2 type transport system ATP-binding protein
VTASAIIATGIRKQYGELRALDGLDLEVAPGEIFGLVGANGAGKTTLIKVLVGILRPDAGSVRVFGLDPFAEPAAVRTQLGYMPQAPALYEDLTARENLHFFASAQATGKQAATMVDAVLHEVELADRGHDLVHTLSGGMKQRLSLACALLRRPRLLLLDEPSTGVDPQLRERLWSYFREQAGAGTTIVLSTHQMDEVFHCDRVAIIRHGQLLACDTPDHLLARGAATVTIWRDGLPQRLQLADYATELPAFLGLQGIERFELSLPAMEDVVLELIAAHEQRLAVAAGAA